MATGWTECLPLLYRSQETVLAAFRLARSLFPFPILGLDADNGGEFINETMMAYCEREQISFTRGRPSLKNDQCFVEQKNGAIVRQVVGYDRLVGRFFWGKLTEERSIPDQVAGLQILYREQERRKRVLGWRRTHKDPFEGEWEQILSWLIANPERSSGDIFRELQRRSPGCYQPLQIRTLQRGMRKIRAHLLESFEEKWQEEVIFASPPPVCASNEMQQDLPTHN